MERPRLVPVALSARGYGKLAVNGKLFRVWLPRLTGRDTNESRPRFWRVEHCSIPKSCLRYPEPMALLHGKKLIAAALLVLMGARGMTQEHQHGNREKLGE